MEFIFYCDLGKIMEERKLNLTELERISGIQKGSLSRIKKSGSINMSTLNKLANSLGEPDVLKLISLKVTQKN